MKKPILFAIALLVAVPHIAEARIFGSGWNEGDVPAYAVSLDTTDLDNQLAGADDVQEAMELIDEFTTGANFLALTDTPSSYSGQANKFVRVNAGATAVEFVTSSGGGDEVEVDSAATTDPDFQDGGDINFTNSSNVITATIKSSTVQDDEIDYTAVTLADFTNDAGFLTSEVDGSTTNELQNLFQTHNAPTGTDPVADSQTDTLNWTVTGPLVLTGTSGTDTMAFSWSGTFADAQIDGSLEENEINHDNLIGFVANEHLDWTASVGTIHAGNVGAAHIDAITEIASGLKSGADATLLTGTATNGECAQFNVDGDLVGAGAACGSGGSLETQTNGTQQSAATSIYDWDTNDFTLTESPADDFDITLAAEIPHTDENESITGAWDYGGGELEIPNSTVAGLGTATLGRIAIVTDGSDADDCTTGGGSTVVHCMANGSTWEPSGDSGAGGSGATTDGGAVTYVTGTTDDFAIGGTDDTAAIFFDEGEESMRVGTSGSGNIDFGTNTLTDTHVGNIIKGHLRLKPESAKLTGDHITTAATIDSGHGPWRLQFSGDATDEAVWYFRMPHDYESNGVVKIGYVMETACSSETIDFEAKIMAVTDGDSTDVDSAGFDTLNEITGGTTCPATADYLDEISISLVNDDSVQAGDLVALHIQRDHDDADDDPSGSNDQAEVVYVDLEYDR